MRPRYLLAIATILALALASAPTPLEATPLGQIARGSVRVNGTVFPFGATLFDGIAVSTDELAAVLYLRNRQTIQLQPNSAARLLDNGENRILVELLSGGLVYANALGEAATLEGSGSVVVGQQGGQQIGEGDQVKQDEPAADEEPEPFCVLLNSDPAEQETCIADPQAKVCNWQFQKHPPSEAPANSRPYGQDGLKCKKKKVGPLILAGGLLGAGGGAGLAAGAAAGLVIVDDVLDLDVITEDEASPTR